MEAPDWYLWLSLAVMIGNMIYWSVMLPAWRILYVLLKPLYPLLVRKVQARDWVKHELERLKKLEENEH